MHHQLFCKTLLHLPPGILNQLGAESLTHLKKLASNVAGSDIAAKDGDDNEEDDDDDVPDLVENFDEASKGEGIVQGEKAFCLCMPNLEYSAEPRDNWYLSIRIPGPKSTA